MSGSISSPGISRITEASNAFERIIPTSPDLLLKFNDFFTALTSSDGLSSDLAKKTKYLGENFKTALEYVGELHEKLFSLYNTAATCNAMILQEALFYNLFSTFMDERNIYLNHPSYSNAYRLFGPMTFGMTLNSRSASSAAMDSAPSALLAAHSLRSDLRDVNTESLTEDECKALFTMTSALHINKEGEVVVNRRKLFPILSSNMKSSCEIIQAFAAKIFLILGHNAIIINSPTLFLISSHLIDKIKELRVAPNAELNPIFSLFFRTKIVCSISKKDLSLEIYSPEFVSKFIHLKSGAWLDEQAFLYGIIEKILNKVNRIIYSALKSKIEISRMLNDAVKKQAKDSIVMIVSRVVNELFEGKPSSVFPLQAARSRERFPISSSSPLISGQDAFLKFCTDHGLYNRLDDQIRRSNAFSQLSAKAFYFPKKRLSREEESTSLPKDVTGGAGGGGASAGAAGAGGGASAGAVEGGCAHDETILLEKDVADRTLMSVSTKPVASVKTPKLPIRFTIHPRVRAWQRSSEEGLAYYHYDEAIPGSLPPHEMILRHRLPPQLLKLAFRKEYSVKSLWKADGATLEHRHFESLLGIDEKLYILEATIDQNEILYHFYARKASSTNDYIKKEISVPKVVAFTPEDTEAEDPFLEIVSGGEVVYNSTDDAIMTFEGHVYKLLKKIPKI